jgi:hypothetical protein
MPQVRVAQHGLVGGQARERQPRRADPRTVLLGREEADAVAACAQPERQREEREQVAGRADRDDDVVSGFDGASLLCVAATVRESVRLVGVANIEPRSAVSNCPSFACRSLT